MGRNILNLFLSFLKIGAITFGGGYAMVAVIEEEVCERRKWLPKEEFLDIIAVAESTPGPIAINSATFVGYRTQGVLGSAAATLGVVLPSFLIISILSLFLRRFYDHPVVMYAFRGIRVGVVVLIANAVISLSKGIKWNKVWTVCAIAAFLAVVVFSAPVIPVIAAGAVAGIIDYQVRKKLKQKDRV